jgi:AraC-like DNA-binding protein
MNILNEECHHYSMEKVSNITFADEYFPIITQLYREIKETSLSAKRIHLYCSVVLALGIKYGILAGDSDPYEKAYKRGVAFLQEHFKEPITIDSLCQEMYLSRSQVFQVFHAFGSPTPVQALNGLRVEHAMGLLKKGEKTVYGVAIESGFENERTFQRAFKQSTGLSPSQYASIFHNNPYFLTRQSPSPLV